MNAILALEDGTVLRGDAFGAIATACGEVCFNTSMTGYQEVLTDPSYKAQIVAMTYPLIGNYGINSVDIESWQPQVAGFVIRELSPVASNWRSDLSLEQYLENNGIPGIQGVDTRALTKKLRIRGAMKGVLSSAGLTAEDAVARAQAWRGLDGIDYVKEVTHKEPFVWDPDDNRSGQFQLVHGQEADNPRHLQSALRPADIPIVAFDFGIKYNILRRLRQCGFRVFVVPANASSEQVLQRKPAGVFLSNGPGDPSALGYAVRAISELVKFGMPIFGICLGHQILGLSFGGKTFKLKFGHRGANQPVKNLETGQVEITSQNHGFAVDPKSLPPEIMINRVNLNDQTVEGMRHRRLPIFCVQYHPEASPGPHDSSALFEEFRKMIEHR